MPFTDTSPAAAALQLEIQRKMSGEERIMLALEMSLFARRLSESRIRVEHPEWADSQVARELIRIAFLPGDPPPVFR